MNDPFLIDECLTLDLVAAAQIRGHHATHVAFRALQGTEDHGLLRTIRAEGFVLVTSNGRDFRRLYGQQPIHAGLIIIVPGGILAVAQVRLFNLVLDAIEPMTDLINKLVEVDAVGSVVVKDFPEP